NEAWHSVKYKLLDAVSIGYNVLEDGIEQLKNGGYRFSKWEILELSLVGVPAYPEAVITALQSADSATIRKALGVKPEDELGRAVRLIRARDEHIRNGAVSLR